jgi:ATP-dependent RNA helicase DDX10/DBP4
MRLATSRKALAKRSALPSKTVFDDEGVGHQVYELATEKEFKEQGPVEELVKRHFAQTKERMDGVDKVDKVEEKEKRRTKKLKRETARVEE